MNIWMRSAWLFTIANVWMWWGSGREESGYEENVFIFLYVQKFLLKNLIRRPPDRTS